MEDNTYNTISVFIAIAFFIIVIRLCLLNFNCDKENFGALQSLYANDGIQDTYLTIEDDDNPNKYDKYSHWEDSIWDLPTRNLFVGSYNPTTHDDNYVDRYATSYPYW